MTKMELLFSNFLTRNLFLHGIHYVSLSTLEFPKQYAEINFVKKLEILLPKLKFLPKK